MSFVWGKTNYFATKDKMGIYFTDSTKTTCVVGGQYFTKKEECEEFVRRLNNEAHRRRINNAIRNDGVVYFDNDIL